MAEQPVRIRRTRWATARYRARSAPIRTVIVLGVVGGLVTGAALTQPAWGPPAADAFYDVAGLTSPEDALEAEALAVAREELAVKVGEAASAIGTIPDEPELVEPSAALEQAYEIGLAALDDDGASRGWVQDASHRIELAFEEVDRGEQQVLEREDQALIDSLGEDVEAAESLLGSIDSDEGVNPERHGLRDAIDAANALLEETEPGAADREALDTARDELAQALGTLTTAYEAAQEDSAEPDPEPAPDGPALPTTPQQPAPAQPEDPAPPTTPQQPAPAPQQASTSLSMTCSATETVSVTATGSGTVRLSAAGAASGSTSGAGSATLTVTFSGSATFSATAAGSISISSSATATCR